MGSRRLFSVCFWVSLAGCGGNVAVGAGGNGGGGGDATTGSTGTATAPDDFTACDGPGQCTLVSAGCCEPCGVPELAQYAAVNVAQGMAYKDFTCPEPVPCVDCVPGYNPHLFAYCDTAAGKCVAADARTHAVSACTSHEQCHVRGGADCCEICDELTSAELTAVSSAADPSLGELVCNPETPCPPCAALYPDNAVAVCSGDTGHCEVAVLEN